MTLSQADDLALFERAWKDAQGLESSELSPTQVHGLRGHLALQRGAANGAEAVEGVLGFVRHQAEKERKRAEEKPDQPPGPFQNLVRTLQDREKALRDEARTRPEVVSGSTFEQRKELGGYVWERLSRYMTHLSSILLAHHVGRNERR